MIPRTKVNYGLRDIAVAFLVSEGSHDYRAELVEVLSKYLGETNVLLTPSGRGGLYFILKALDRPRVVIPAYTCKAVAEAAILAGKNIICVDVEPGGFNVPSSALDTIVDSKSIVIATHQFGIPCEIERIVALSARRGALVVEDVAPSLGTRLGNRLVGTYGDAAFYSFDSTKLVNVPMKGGLVTAKDPDLLARIKAVMNAETTPMPWSHKMKLLVMATGLVLIENPVLYSLFHAVFFSLMGKYTEEIPGLNPKKTEFYIYTMANWQAFTALSQVRRLDAIIEQRRQVYTAYSEALEGCRSFELPPKDENGEWACIRFPIRVKGNKFAYYSRVAKQGVDVAFSFTYPPCTDDSVHAKAIADSILDIPYYWKLTSSEFDRVVSVLKAIDNET